MSESHDESELLTPPTLDSPTQDPLSSSIYQSAYSPEDFNVPRSLGVQASMYHSAISDSFFRQEDDFGEEDERAKRKKGNGTKETHHRKVLFARERQFAAHLTINEALLSISSRGKPILCVGLEL